MTRIEATARFLREGTSVRLQAFGHSMTPAIVSGDVLVVEPERPDRLRVGDVVLCRIGWHLIAHRIARLAPGPRFLVRADQLGRDDGWLEPDRILGRVSAIERDGRRAPVPYRPLALAARRFAGEVRQGLLLVRSALGLNARSSM